MSSEYSDFLSSVFCQHYIYALGKRTILLRYITSVKVVDAVCLITIDSATNRINGTV